jgi:hypothetical protein
VILTYGYFSNAPLPYQTDNRQSAKVVNNILAILPGLRDDVEAVISHFTFTPRRKVKNSRRYYTVIVPGFARRGTFDNFCGFVVDCQKSSMTSPPITTFIFF